MKNLSICLFRFAGLACPVQSLWPEELELELVGATFRYNEGIIGKTTSIPVQTHQSGWVDNKVGRVFANPGAM